MDRRAGPTDGARRLILADTSAWLEYLHGTGSPIHLQMRELFDVGQVVATTEPVVMELSAGARGRTEFERLDRAFAACKLLPVMGLTDWEAAAGVYRTCRRSGGTPRSQLDCLIACVAIRTGTPLLHRDADFDLIAKHTSLDIHIPV